SPRKPRSRDSSQVRTNDLFRAAAVSSGAVVCESAGISLVRHSAGISVVWEIAGISVVWETAGISVVADIAVASHSLFAAGGDPTSAGTAPGSDSSAAQGRVPAYEAGPASAMGLSSA